MRHLKVFNESEGVSIFSQEIKNFFPDKIYISTTHGDWELDKNDLMLNGDLIQMAYYHNPSKESNDALSDGEPAYLEFDIHIDRNERGIKLLVDITYGDSMVSEFSIEAPNKINVIHYTGINSKYDPETYFGFNDETINDLVNLFNSFNHGLELSSDDFKFIDKDPNNYKYTHNTDHLYNDDSDLVEFGNSTRESILNDIILVINNSKPPENKYLYKVLKYLDFRGI